MEITRATRTHLIYQFIILTLLFVGIAFNEILPDRKYILFFALAPIFCYQLVILSCCLELMPIPSWMSFLQPVKKEGQIKRNSEKSLKPVKPSRPQSESLDSPEPADPPPLPYTRRWEKSVMNLGATPKRFVHSQKSKSWMNLSDSKSSEMLSSREGSLDSLVAVPERKCFKNVKTREEKRKREERTTKARSWKNNKLNMDEKPESTNTAAFFTKSDSHSIEVTDENKESEFEKSYSFPFRQKRLQTWFEMKESDSRQENEKKEIPYWESVGYNLAVKYEARRRRRATSQSSKTNVSNEELRFQKSGEYAPELAPEDKPNPKKLKSASLCMNKIKVGFTNLLSKKKEDSTDTNLNSNKINRSSFFRPKNKSASFHAREKENLAMPEFPRFLNNDRPLFFYPRNIPFEKERFESDVQKRMAELDEQKNSPLI